jgi:hypothetical protein
MIDPAINYMYQKMRTELKETKEKLDLAQSELAACKFTPDSQTGKKLMSRCRTLIQVSSPPSRDGNPSRHGTRHGTGRAARHPLHPIFSTI